MSTLRKCLYLLSLIAVAACAPAVAAPAGTQTPAATAPAATQAPTPAPAKVTPAPSGSADDTLIIRYHRSGGFAGTDDTWLIYASGRTAYTGTGQGHASQLDASQLAALMAVLRSPEVAALKESKPTNICCDRFMHEITLTLDGKTQTLRTVDGAPDESPALTSLMAALGAALK